MVIRKRYDRSSNTVPVFNRNIDFYGYDRLKHKTVLVGKRDQIAFIDAPAADCTVKAKIQRFMAGDVSALGNGSASGIYLDLSGVPTDYNSIRKCLDYANSICSKAEVPDVGALFTKLSDTAVQQTLVDNLTTEGGSIDEPQ